MPELSVNATGTGIPAKLCRPGTACTENLFPAPRLTQVKDANIGSTQF